MATDLDQYTDAELRELLAVTGNMNTYRAARRILDKRAQAKAAQRRAQVPRQREPEAQA